MSRSMTGFGRDQMIINGRDILVEIKSVNHRYYEFYARVPRTYGYLEDKLKHLVQNKISRGKVEVSVSIYNIDKKDTAVNLNSSVALGYIEALRGIKDEMNLHDDLALSHIINLPDVFTLTKQNIDEDEIWNAVSSVAVNALDKFVEMREIEGKRLKEDIINKLKLIAESIKIIEENSDKYLPAYRERLYDKMKQILQDSNIDEQRIFLEAAIYAEKSAIDEELVRIKSHLKQFDQMLSENEVIGRKLDFLIQELNREVNTIGSKAQDLEITKLIVEIKSEIEKIREQIQNIE